MSKHYDLIVFDWEGTIVDTLGALFNSVAQESVVMGLNLDPDKLRNFVELGLVNAVKKAYPQLTEAEKTQLVHAVQMAMYTRSSEIWLIPGVRECIDKIHSAGVQIAIATNKSQSSLSRALQHTGLDKLFKVTRSAGQVPPKPCPQMLEEIMDVFNVKVQKTLMVGDSPIDMEMAHSIKVDAVGMDFYHQEEHALKLSGALEVFADYTALQKYLKL